MKFEVGDGRAVRGRDDPVGVEGVQLVDARAPRRKMVYSTDSSEVWRGSTLILFYSRLQVKYPFIIHRPTVNVQSTCSQRAVLCTSTTSTEYYLVCLHTYLVAL